MEVDPIERPGPPTGTLMARLDRPATSRRTRLAVFADPHLGIRSEGTMKLFEHTRAHLEFTVADIEKRDVDAAVCVGDLTKDGEPWNYEAFDEVIADLDVPFYAIPGNHDVPKHRDDHETPPIERFEREYTPGGLPYHDRVGGVDLIGLNTSGTAEFLYESHDGGLTDADRAWLDDRLGAVETPVVLSHFNLPAIADQLRAHRDAVEPGMAIPPEFRDPEPFIETLARHDVPLVLTGHYHFPSTAAMRGVREVMAPTTCSFPQAYLLADIGPEGAEIRYVPIVDNRRMRYAHQARRSHSETARGLTSMAAIRVANFPLVDERTS